jgi:hypothetical protein
MAPTIHSQLLRSFLDNCRLADHAPGTSHLALSTSPLLAGLHVADCPIAMDLRDQSAVTTESRHSFTFTEMVVVIEQFESKPMVGYFDSKSRNFNAKSFVLTVSLPSALASTITATFASRRIAYVDWRGRFGLHDSSASRVYPMVALRHEIVV